jgi:hypothetical protein
VVPLVRFEFVLLIHLSYSRIRTCGLDRAGVPAYEHPHIEIPVVL